MGNEFDANKRRTVTGFIGSAIVAGLGSSKSLVAAEGGASSDPSYAFLAPLPVQRFDAPLRRCVDVHAHFFNASDVTVEGYLEGPVAHSFGNLGWLVRALAKIADGLGEIAIKAKDEMKNLPIIEERVRGADFAVARKALWNLRDEERRRISREFNELTKTPRGREFREGYASAARAAIATSGLRVLSGGREIDDNSLVDAQYAGEEIPSDETIAGFASRGHAFYLDGLLGFIAYMLSSRWTNLLSYQENMTTKARTIGVDTVFSALVDFDRWLDGHVRSPHEDQLVLHAELSKRSNGYMRPLMSYNPWTDIAEQGRGLALVEEAAKANYLGAKAFVGTKIYPANGFQAYGNRSQPDATGRPTGAQLDDALKVFWLKCHELDLPVMSHAGPRMGKNDRHDVMGGPAGWKALLEADFWPDATGPRLNLGHFGGEKDHPRKPAGADWPNEFVDLMTAVRGDRVFADLGYWDNLNQKAKDRLKEALNHANGGKAPATERVMFGTDWLMLSRENNWSSYPSRLLKAIQEIAPNDVDRIFSLNAKHCFSRL